MTWRRPGDKPLSKLMIVSLLTHICITRFQWVNKLNARLFMLSTQDNTFSATVVKWALQLLSKALHLISGALHLISRALQIISGAFQLLIRVLQLISWALQLISRGLQLLNAALYTLICAFQYWVGKQFLYWVSPANKWGPLVIK